MLFDSSEVFCLLAVIFASVFQIVELEASVSDGGEFYPFALFLELGIVHSNSWLAHDSDIFEAQRVHNSSKVLNV